MEYYEVFMKVILKEVAKFNLNIDVYSTHISQLTSALNENFDIPYNRCAYLYRYGTVLTHFFYDCINIFFTSYSHTKDIFSIWKSYSEVKVCSLSTGPGLDFIGFMSAVLEYDSSPPNFEVVVISKNGAWRNTKNLILEVFNDSVSTSQFSKVHLQYQNLNVVQLNFLKNYSFGNMTAASEANVIFMMKTLNLLAPGAPQEKHLLQMFKEFIPSLKPETIIFCLDTKPSVSVLIQAILNCHGKFLYGPDLHTDRIPATFPEFNEHNPTLTARGVFFVWQKLPDPLSSYVTEINTSIGAESNDNLICVDNSFDKSNSSLVENVSNIDVKEGDNLNLPWMELKSFWQCSSPKTKEVLKKLILTDEESLEHINDFMSRKTDTSAENSLKTFQNSVVEDIKISKKEVGLNTTEAVKSEGTQAISAPSQSELHDDLSVNNQRNTYNYDMHSYTNGSPSSVGNFSCENKRFEEFLSLGKNTSSGKFSPVDLGKLPRENGYHELDKKNSKKILTPRGNLEPFLSLENKSIQTDRLLDSTTAPSPVKVLTDRIRQLAISLDSVSQQNVPSNSSSGDFFPFNQTNEGPHPSDCTEEPSCSKLSPNNRGFKGQGSLSSRYPFNQTNEGPHPSYCTEKPSCSKLSPNRGFKDQGSLSSCHSCRNAPCQNMGSHYSCHCSHNRCLNCSFQPYCKQPIQRCNFACHHQSEENNENAISSNIVIPLHNISDNALLQIISILKSEPKT